MSLLSLGSLLALDNIIAALALAPLCRNRAQFIRLIACFAAAESIGPVAGALLHPSLPALLSDGSLAAGLVVTLGMSVIGLTLAQQFSGPSSMWFKTLATALPPERWLSSFWPVAALSILLGIDNVLAGTGMPLSMAAACGAASGAAVVAACLLGRTIGLRLTPPARSVVCGVLLVTAGAMSWA